MKNSLKLALALGAVLAISQVAVGQAVQMNQAQFESFVKSVKAKGASIAQFEPTEAQIQANLGDPKATNFEANAKDYISRMNDLFGSKIAYRILQVIKAIGVNEALKNRLRDYVNGLSDLDFN